MEDGPTSRTRKKTLHRNGENGESPLSEEGQFAFEQEFDNKQNYKTPQRRHSKGKRIARTPSGQVLSTSVKDIRNFFQQDIRRSDDLPPGVKHTANSQDNSQSASQ